MPSVTPESHKDSRDCSCFKCKIKSIQLSPKATPTRTYRRQTRTPTPDPWGGAQVRDERGMPLLKANMDPITHKDYENNRTKYDQLRREMKASPEPNKES